MRTHSLIKKAMADLGMPLLFATLGYALLYVAASPVIVPLRNLVSLISLDSTTDPDAAMDSTDLFAGSQAEAGETIKASSITFPTFGDRFGNISIKGTSVDAPLYFGDSNTILKNGVGQYNGSLFPGCGSTVLVGGHNNSYFNGLKSVKVGNTITLKTNYGVYTYKVTKTAVLPATDKSAYDLKATQENLVLYTCYPFDMLGLTPNRYFVYADYVSGPRVLLDQ